MVRQTALCTVGLLRCSILLKSLCSPGLLPREQCLCFDGIHLCVGLNENAIWWVRKVLHGTRRGIEDMICWLGQLTANFPLLQDANVNCMPSILSLELLPFVCLLIFL